MVLTVSFVLFPVIGLVCHRHPRDAKHHHELNASVEASEPHDFAVRFTRRSSKAPSASTASRLTSVTIAKRPSERRDGANLNLIWGKREGKYF
jgi:hypothetical protein